MRPPIPLALLASLALLRIGAADPVQQLVTARDDLQGIPFPEVVRETTGKRIIPVNPKKHAALLKKLAVALDATVVRLNRPDHPIHDAGRINEASRAIEDELRAQLNAVPGWKCTVPLTADGREQRSGYPDLRLETEKGLIVYLDPKLYAAESRESSLRTFYYEPKSLTGKIHDNAIHLLVGMPHEGSDAKTLKIKGWELVDLSRLTVRLKAEFQASNADIYRPETIVGSSSTTNTEKLKPDAD